MMKKFGFLMSYLLVASLSSLQAQAPDNWFNLDPQTDKVNGIGSEKAYQSLLKGRKSVPVIVAVIDSGVDSEHEDLKEIMWTNTGEIPNNGIDDDGNGYIDDVHGWNFLGGKGGKNVHHETLEITRVYAKLKKRFDDKSESAISSSEKNDFKKYQSLKKIIEEKRDEAQGVVDQIEQNKSLILGALNGLNKALDGKPLTPENVNALSDTDDQNVMIGKKIMEKLFETKTTAQTIDGIKAELETELKEGLDHYQNQLEYGYNPDYDSRALIVGDNPDDYSQRIYGNNDVKGPDASHGTHVAGIIGASRNNAKGMNGVADNVRIMSVRCVPDGDERDKDVANAIRYAVDNGAQVINMSFGKGYSVNKEAVDNAVKYAEAHDVLLVHAAGNDGGNNDTTPNFPNPRFEKTGWFKPKRSKSWIEVGALSWKQGEDMVASFSNYGKDQVDLFSPGMAIYSTTPDNTYASFDGTSMASPVTAGVAALLRSYYPDLTAKQIKEVIVGSAVKQNIKVKKPGSDGQKIDFMELCASGGIVSAYEAVKMAATIKGKKKVKNRV